MLKINQKFIDSMENLHRFSYVGDIYDLYHFRDISEIKKSGKISNFRNEFIRDDPKLPKS